MFDQVSRLLILALHILIMSNSPIPKASNLQSRPTDRIMAIKILKEKSNY